MGLKRTVNLLRNSGEVDGLDTTNLLVASKGRADLLGGSCAGGGTSNGDKGAALGGSGQLAGSLATESLGETS